MRSCGAFAQGNSHSSEWKTVGLKNVCQKVFRARPAVNREHLVSVLPRAANDRTRVRPEDSDSSLQRLPMGLNSQSRFMVANSLRIWRRSQS
jgi:hypothetical protein